MRFIQKLLLCLGIIATSSLCFAQSSDIVAKPVPNAPVAKTHWTKITLPDGSITRIMLREGEMGTIFFANENRGIGIVPVASESKSAPIALKIFNITLDANKQEIVTPGAVISVATFGEATYSHGGMNFKIELVEHQPVSSVNDGAQCNSPGKAGQLAQTNNVISAGRCCLTCGSTTACGIRVDNDCGSCCSDC
ncbi:MAG: hypothetical protein RL748_4307 [Pseudomonadota bacterium]|jgi:hypothetical protein